MRWGILGCGDVTEKKSGSGAMNHCGSALVAVMRRDAEKAKDYAARHGVEKWFSDAGTLVADPSVSAVYIATPPSAHLELALQVAAAGKPCLVEKPMARNLPDSQRMAAAFEAAGVPLFVAYYRRHYPRVLRMRELLGRLGDITLVSYRFSRPPRADGSGGWREVASVSGGGVFVDIGSHVLDILDFLLGPLQEVHGCARGEAGAVEQRVAASFGWAGGAVGTASWDFCAPLSEDVLEVRGTRGVLTAPGLMNGDAIELSAMADGGDCREVHPPPPTVQQPLFAAVVDVVRSGDGSRCASTAASALRTQRVIDAILESYYRGRGDAFWERPATWQPAGPPA